MVSKHDKRYPQPISSIRDMLEKAVKKDPKHIAYMFREGKENIVSISNQEFYDSVEALGASLVSYGLEKSHIACVGENSYPWIQAYLTTLMTAGVFVPVDKELPIENIIYILNNSDSEAVFCSAKYEMLFREHRNELPNIKYFICFDLKEYDEDDTFLSFPNLIEKGKKLDKTSYDLLRSDPNALKYLVYTSGTTGIAKGVMLTEHNLVSSIYYGMMVASVLDRGLSVLPYNHCYEAVCDILVAIHSHTTLCINDSLKRVLENIRLFKPDYIYLVPAFSEHFYNSIQKAIRKKNAEKTFEKTIKLSNKLRKVGIDMRRVFFKDILATFGGNLKKIVCGGATIRPEIGEFFDNIGITLTGGYGITECSPLVSVNDEKNNNFSTAGHRLSCITWRINEPNEDGIGEICIHGDIVMKGYYKRPDLTEEAIKDGWFFTGDYGYITEDDQIVLTGRKKNIIVLNNGKNVYPEEIEGYISKVPYVTEVVVRGIKNEFHQDIALSAEIYCEDENMRDEGKLKHHIDELLHLLPSYKWVHQIILRDSSFPKTTTNKIIRN